MKVNRSVEHAVLAVLMMAVQQGHTPLKSHTMSQVMGVSDSYLKKTLRKLAVAGIVESSASKEGGYTLARPVSDITLGDIYRALEPDGFSFRSSPLAEAVFPDGGEHITESVVKVSTTFEEGYTAFLSVLDNCPLSSLLEEGVWQNGVMSWVERANRTERASVIQRA